jgi:hypothetical protein
MGPDDSPASIVQLLNNVAEDVIFAIFFVVRDKVLEASKVINVDVTVGGCRKCRRNHEAVKTAKTPRREGTKSH